MEKANNIFNDFFRDGPQKPQCFKIYESSYLLSFSSEHSLKPPEWSFAKVFSQTQWKVRARRKGF